MDAVTAFVVAAPVAFLVAWLAKVAGPKLGLVDLPDGALKTHRVPVVPLGGIGVATGFLVASALLGALSSSVALAVMAVAVLGLADDRVSLSPRLRLGFEVGAGIVLVSGPLIDGALNGVEAVVGVVATVVLINAVNLFDGLDGLVTSSAAAGLGGAAALAVVWGGDGILAVAGMGALLGFLIHNWHPAKMFLGDNGSYTVGTILAAVVIESAVSGHELPGMIAVSSAGTVYLVDLASTLFRRRRAGVPLFLGDRSHTYDRLHDAGWSIRRVAVTAALVNGAATSIVVATVAVVGTTAGAVVAVILVLSLTGVAVAGVLRPGPVQAD